MGLSNRYTFRWTCSYMNCAYYDVHGDGERFEVSLRRGVCDYERSITSMSDEQWQSEVVSVIDVLCCTNDRHELTQEMVDAFNEWRTAEYWRYRREIDAQPERYGVVDWDGGSDPWLKCPEPVKGANYRVEWIDRKNFKCRGLGWEIVQPKKAAA